MDAQELLKQADERAAELAGIIDGAAVERAPDKLVLRSTISMVMEHATLARLDRLRACLGVARSEVIHLALVTGIATLEATNKYWISRFGKLAAASALTWEEYAGVYAREFSRMTHPPKVDELEAMAADGRRLTREGLRQVA